MIGGEHLPSIYYISNIIWHKKVIFLNSFIPAINGCHNFCVPIVGKLLGGELFRWPIYNFSLVNIL